MTKQERERRMYKYRRIEKHPLRNEIINDLSLGMSQKDVSQKYSISHTCINKYIKEVLWPMAAAQFQHEQKDGANKIRGRVEGMVDIAEKMLKSVDEHLTDPDNPERYILDPAAGDIDVTYLETTPGGGTKRSKAKLQDLIDRVESEEKQVVALRSKQIDLKELLLKSIDSMERALSLLAKIDGSIQDPQKLDLTLFPVWQEIQVVLMNVTKDHPEAKDKIIDGLKKLSATDS
ncbi:MAG: hypothetical protein LAT56_00380 [Wenzhouxiangella sp.]|nr:hypothetical protein [Wenzhouxiangella sp.]